MLDRLDELPLRRHEIRGNPAGLLARLLRRIDVLKHEAVAPAALREWAVARERDASNAAERERAEREIEFADLYARHDRILRESGSLDGGDLVLELAKLLGARADVARRGRRALRGRCSSTSSRTRASPTGAVIDAIARPRQRHGRLRPGAGDAALSRCRRRCRSKRSPQRIPTSERIDLGESLRGAGGQPVLAL